MSNTINFIHEDQEGGIWLGTANGLSKWIEPTNTFKTNTHQDGLRSHVLAGLVEDDSGNFWISTFSSLVYFDRKNGNFQYYTQRDGLSHNEFNRFSFFKDQDRRLYFGGVNGINTFFPDDLKKEAPLFMAQLARVNCYNTRKEEYIDQRDHLQNLQSITLHPYDVRLELDLMAPFFDEPGENMFSSRLLPTEPEWTPPSRNSKIRFEYLKPGTYQLEVRIANSNGQWSPKIRKLKVLVQPKFYETAWFKLLAVLLTAALAAGIAIYHWYQRLQKERLRTELSSNLHDEVSGMIAGVAMQTDLLQQLHPNFERVDQLRKMGITLRSAMSKIQDILWSVDARKDSMEELIEKMKQDAVELLSPLGIQSEFQVKNLPLHKKLPVNIRQELYFIFKEALNNSAKHSNASKVQIIIAHREKQFFFEVKDNGQTQKGKNTPEGQGLKKHGHARRADWGRA